MDDIMQIANEVWEERLTDYEDATHTLIISTTTDSPNANNLMDFKKTSQNTKDYVFDKLLGGWETDVQASPEGLHLDRKSGRCAIPNRKFSVNEDIIKGYLKQNGTHVTFNGETVRVTLVEMDPYANTTIIYMERSGA